MNKPTFIGLTVLFLSLGFLIINSHAQSRLPYNPGIKAGLNLAEFNGAEYDNQVRTGLSFGVFADIEIPDLPVTVQPELLYTQKGAKVDEENVSGTFKVNYIEIPILAKYAFPQPEPVTPFLLLGPSFSINVRSEGDFPGNNGLIPGNWRDDTHKTDIGAVVGIGLDIPQDMQKFIIELRYTHGFREVYVEDFSDGERNGVFSILVGMEF